MTHLTMYGRGHFNRMRGVVAPPPRPALRAYPKAEPAQASPADDPRVVVTAIGFLNDALTDARLAARATVNAEAANYRLPAVPKTRSEAIMAYILLMRNAETEQPLNAAHFQQQAREAAYKFRAASIPNILYTAVGLTKTVPRTNVVARDLYAALPADTLPTPAKKKTPAPARAKNTSTKLRVSTDTGPAVETPGESWQDRFAMLPSWVPWVAGGAFVAAAAWLILPRKATTPVVAVVKP